MDLVIQPNLTQVNNVALGQVFSFDLPIGPAYAFIDLIITMTAAAGKTLTKVSDFLDLTTVNANGKAQRTFLGIEADAIHTKFGANYAALIFNSTGAGNALVPVYANGVPQAPQANAQTTMILRIYFQEPWRKTWAGANYRKLYTAWPASKAYAAPPITSLQIQGYINNTTNNAGATSINVLVSTGTDNSLGQLDKTTLLPVNNLLKWYRSPVNYVAAGDQNITNFIKYAKGTQLAIVEQIDVFSGSTGDDVTRVVVTADSRKVRDVTSTVNNDDLVRHGFNAPWNADQFTICFDVTDDITSGLFLSTAQGTYVNTFTVTATLNQAAGANKVLNILSQVWGPMD
jgi:hypothetical protein